MGKQLFKSLIFLGIFFAFGYAQAQKTITGTVSDADGPLPGAAVVVQGTTEGVTTDFDGNYSIEASEGQVLEFSFIGMTTAMVTVGSDDVINVTLESSENRLEEVVVVGYSQQTRGDITGSVESVDMEEAMKVPTSNAATALQGRVSGVTVQSNAAPGAAPVINIRGVGTTNNSGPLYIIDGVQTTDANVLNSISPQDIDQMNVLKDGAASIYGARAANGVIIVTTKSGSYNMEKSTVTVDIYSGVQSAYDGPDLLNAQQHGEMLWESQFYDAVNQGTEFIPTHYQYGNGPVPVVPEVLNLAGLGEDHPRFGTIAPVDPNGTDWWNVITRSAPVVNAVVSVQGGTETSKSFMSVGYLNQQGVLEHTGFVRGNIQLNNEFKPTERLKIGQHLNVSYSTNQMGDNLAVENAVRSSPLVPVYDSEGRFAGTYQNSFNLSNNENPLSLLARSKDDYIRNFRAFGDVYASYEIIEGLTFKSTFAGSIAAWDMRIFTPLNPEHGEPITYNNLLEQDQNFYTWTWTNMLNYRTTFGSDHNLNAFIATEALQNINKGKEAQAQEYFNETPDFYLLDNAFQTGVINWAYANQNSLFSVFGSADYNYKQKYFLTATLRYDKSSRFAGDAKDDIFPSFSAGWVMSNEDWFNNSGVISRLKLKASYGELGNQDLPVNNPTKTLYAFAPGHANYVWGNTNTLSPGAYLDTPANENLEWETSVTSNFGVEMGFLADKLYTSLEFYQIVTDGLFAQDNTLIPTTGPDSNAPWVNLGEVKNTGFDWTLGYSNTWESGFRFGVDFNLSHYKNEVVSLVNGTPVTGEFLTSWAGAYTRTQEGEEISYFYGLQVEGFDENGGYIFQDTNGDGTINSDDRTKIGSPHPDFTYGLNLNAGFKGFDFSAFFQGSQGNDIYNHNKIFTDFPLFVHGNRSTRVLDSWRPDNTDATLPVLSMSTPSEYLNAQSYFVEDGSYLRLKNLQIGYTFEDISGLDNLRLYMQGTNLFTITDYNGTDPEVLNRGNTTMGVDYRVYPLSRIFTIGVNVKF